MRPAGLVSGDTGRRIHQLAQAAQVGDLLAERAEQLLEQLDRPAGTRNDEVLAMLFTNLRRQVDAYRSVRS
jgi:hypothetical protein